jgi:hypothetical protein
VSDSGMTGRRELQLMYALLRLEKRDLSLPGLPDPGELKGVRKEALRTVFADPVDGHSLSTAVAFALADSFGPGAGALAAMVGMDPGEGEALAAAGREAVCTAYLAMLRGRAFLKPGPRESVDRLFASILFTLLNVYQRAQTQLSLAASVVTANSKMYDRIDEKAARAFARELLEIVNPAASAGEEEGEPAAQAPEAPAGEDAPTPAAGAGPARGNVDSEKARKLRRLRIAALRAKSALG